MHKGNNKAGWNNYFYFIIAVLFYISFIIIFVIVMKEMASRHIISDIDRRLLIVAKSIPQVLAEDYHDRAVNPAGISGKEWRKTERRLTELAAASGVRYAWTDVLVNGKVYMTSCNRTEQTDEAGLELYYFMPYNQGVSDAELSAFRGMEPVFANFQDKWGRFRAVFVPCMSPGGKKYLACAEYTTDYVDGMIGSTKMFLSLTAFLFFLAFLPVLFVYRRSLKHESKKLEESELNLRITLNSIGDGVIVTDNNDIITMINPAACAITGFRDDEAAGMELAKVFVLSPEIREESQAAAGRRGEGLNWSAGLRAKDGTEKIIAYNRAAIRTSGGICTGSVIVARDISEIIGLEEDLRQSQKMESIGQLAGGIAHDFNNMLAAIIGSAEMLRMNHADDINTRENIDVILKASEKVSAMTQKLLAFSRKGEIKKEVIDIHKCIENTCTILQRSIDRKIEIRTSLQAGEHHILGDFTLIENVLLNLGINARDAMGDGGIIEIRTRNTIIDDSTGVPPNFSITPGNFIEISVSDTGPGIPKKIQSRIFEPFFTTKGVSRGTGLGLSMVYGTVKQHNGMIRLDSDTGQGTVFTIYIPSVKGEDEVTVKRTFLHKGKGCVLLVDDEELILMSGSNILKGMSYEVLTASDGIEALEIFKNNMDKISIAVIDLIMPRLNGLDLFYEMKALKPGVQIVLSSGFSNDTTVKELLNAGAAAVILKPYSAVELSSILEDVETKNT